jgi:hypothetical protein
MFMALDVPSPAPMSTVVAVYSVAFVENFALYAMAGALVWPIAHFVLKLRNSSGESAKSSR